MALRQISSPHLRLSMGTCLRCCSARAGAGNSRPDPSHNNTEPALDFGNTKEAYRSKSFFDLLRQYAVFKAFSFKFLVDNNKELLDWCQRVFGERIFIWIMKKTVYGQFVAGENLTTIKPKITHLRNSGIRSILDYAVEEDIGKEQEVVMEVRQADPTQSSSYSTEPSVSPRFKSRPVKAAKHITRSSARTHFYGGEEQCEENLKHFMSCIDTASEANLNNEKKDAFAAIKLTGLGRVEFLLRFSEVVSTNYSVFLKLSNNDNGILNATITPQSFFEGMRGVEIQLTESESTRLFKQLDEDNLGRVNVHEFCNRFQPGTELHNLFQTSKIPTVLRHEERAQMDTVVKRTERLAEYAQEKGVRLLIDAEQTYFQLAIRHIVVNVLMPKYNMDTPTIYNTIQCYLKDADKSLQMELALANMTGCLYCVKLVRGAYMEQERERAKDNGYPDPIWPRKKDTDECYNKLVELLMHAKTGSLPSPVHFMIASHNEATVKMAIEKMNEYHISKSDGTVVFGQLLGMCDHITFPLGQAGYGAYKYMPYGPVKEVLPYLSRRANENKGILEGAQRERALVRKELIRRITSLK